LAPPAETALVDAMSEDPPPSYRQRALAAILNIAAWIAIGPDRTSQLFFARVDLAIHLRDFRPPHGAPVNIQCVTPGVRALCLDNLDAGEPLERLEIGLALSVLKRAAIRAASHHAAALEPLGDRRDLRQFDLGGKRGRRSEPFRKQRGSDSGKAAASTQQLPAGEIGCVGRQLRQREPESQEGSIVAHASVGTATG
jgi:hypothetical protein